MDRAAPASVLYLVDASPYIFRAYFALPDSIRTPAGAPANATYGFAGFLLRLVAREDLTHLAVAFDASLTTSFRNDFFPAYKANRELPPPELAAQLSDCRETARALGAATFVSERFEADDLIGTLARRHHDAASGIVVVSGDKDLAQLVDERVALLDFAKDRRLDESAVRETFGVPPRQIVDFLALLGDPVDNIPGVPGIGRKTACALLAEFESLEAIYRNLDAVSALPLRGAKGVAERLAAGREAAHLAKRLVTIAVDAPIAAGSDLASLRYEGARRAEVDALFDRLGFDSIRGRIRNWAGGG